MSDYSPQVWERFREPRHAGSLAAAAQGEARSPASKAVLRLDLRVAGGCVSAARFQALGCPSTIAAGDWLCEWLEGRPLAEAVGLTSARVAEALSLAPARRHCAVMAEDALRAALRKYHE